jgi:hypothetical protein
MDPSESTLAADRAAFNLLLIVGWPLLASLALVQLRRRELPETARVIWAVLILLLPIVGALAFWIVRPGNQS